MKIVEKRSIFMCLLLSSISSHYSHSCHKMSARGSKGLLTSKAHTLKKKKISTYVPHNSNHLFQWQVGKLLQEMNKKIRANNFKSNKQEIKQNSIACQSENKTQVIWACMNLSSKLFLVYNKATKIDGALSNMVSSYSTYMYVYIHIHLQIHTHTYIKTKTFLIK